MYTRSRLDGNTNVRIIFESAKLWLGLLLLGSPEELGGWAEDWDVSRGVL